MRAMARDHVPAAVTAFIERRAGCNHWAGEDPYDPARRREIEAALRSLKCGRIEQDARVLQRRYRDRPPVLQALELSRDWL